MEESKRVGANIGDLSLHQADSWRYNKETITMLTLQHLTLQQGDYYDANTSTMRQLQYSTLQHKYDA